MSKIICEVCGTSYPDTTMQCPICGCVRPGDVQRVTNEINADENGASGYTYVKGGRFSKSNVKKRNKAKNAKAKATTGNFRRAHKSGISLLQTQSNHSGISLIGITTCTLWISCETCDTKRH